MIREMPQISLLWRTSSAGNFDSPRNVLHVYAVHAIGKNRAHFSELHCVG